ncbi:hypothetical protein Fmac_021937 [Flemingia macrophylla]|uniref:Nucleoplasmin-like domain-containing protein n=1 Tax=Flemingia macrophylla TaxID=520843 RepID=A0ABD1LYB3_9FABA
MDPPMQFWGVEVKVGQTVKIDPADPESSYFHVSQVALGEAKKEKASEPVILFVKVGDQKIVLGTLNRNDIPHLSLDLVLDSEFELSHNSKSASVHFCGYKVLTEPDNFSGFSDEDDSDEDLPVEGLENGVFATKSSKPVPLTGASAKQVKTVDPKKEDEDDSDDDDSDEEDNEDGVKSSDEMDDVSDSEEESESDEEDEETPDKKVGKKRPNESASKSPVSTKKAKNASPEKTDGKKSVHIATPYPSKKGGKSPNSNVKGKTTPPNSNAKGNTPNNNAKGKNPNSAGGKKSQFRK